MNTKRVSKIVFLPRENIMNVFKSPCNFLVIVLSSNVLAIVTNEDLEMSGPGCSFV